MWIVITCDERLEIKPSETCSDKKRFKMRKGLSEAVNQINTLNTHIHFIDYHSLSWLGTNTSTKRGEVKPVL
jgi:hypothetical protein